jgi:protein-L-isoaspartate(D-aspartate) O-methyltransferase
MTYGLFAKALALTMALSSVAQTPDRKVEQKTLANEVVQKLVKSGMRKDSYVQAVINTMRQTPRHLFVPDAVQSEAYKDQPLSIGYDQTISSPGMVATMTSLLHIKKSDTVLEIGTGSGYQAAILGQLASEVYSIEIVEPLATEAAARLQKLGYKNVHVRSGDGYAGWPEHQPFDAIIVTAGATHIPPALMEQLKVGGRMVIPVGPSWAQQELTLAEKAKSGQVRQRKFGQVFFVDFTGEMKKH